MKRNLWSLIFCCVVVINFQLSSFGQDDANQEPLDNGRGSVIEKPAVPIPPTKSDVLNDTTPEAYRPSDYASALELNLLFRNRNVQKEIQLTREQAQELRKIHEEMVDSTRQLQAQLRGSTELRGDGSDLDQRARYSGDQSLLEDELAFRQAKFHRKMKEVLLPDQRKWLSQAVMQFRVRKTSEENQSVLMNEYLVEELRITTEQFNEMQEIVKKSEQDLKEVITKHRAATQNDLLKVLNQQQRDAFEEIFSRKIDF